MVIELIILFWLNSGSNVLNLQLKVCSKKVNILDVCFLPTSCPLLIAVCAALNQLCHTNCEGPQVGALRGGLAYQPPARARSGQWHLQD